MGRPPSHNRRRALTLALIAALGLTLVAAPTAGATAIVPEHGGSPNANSIADLYELVLAVALVIFIGVEAALFYSLWKFRARKGAVPAQIRGNTRLEIGWTIGAALILVVLAVFTFAKLPSIRNPPNSSPNGLQLAAGPSKRLPPNGRSLNVCVNGQQYIWRFTYPIGNNCDKIPLNSPYSYEQMVVPTDTTVTLTIRAQDVAHSWWVPKLGGKFDAVPGYTNYTWFKIPSSVLGGKPSRTFTGNCAELCGRNHANMTAQVTAVSPADFEKFIAQRKADLQAADNAAAQQRKLVNAGKNP
ncbi:MAG TPA: cytochrome c oxidase subunit II [Solirubrobacteraceae bacterium]|nr:cytochrome c oxidase subunit II [Solirubrobacteraceae bacterium]